MFQKKLICVLDVEGMSGKRPYNIGYKIADLHGNIILNRSFAVMPFIMENLSGAIKTACNTAREMTHKNISEILTDPVKYNWTLPADFLQVFYGDLVENGVKEIWAYNCSFDREAIQKILPAPDVLQKMGVDWFDIWSAVVMTKCLNKKYVKFCRDNGFVTEKGNCKTSAEVVWAFLTNNPTFEEEHTGLADCDIEYKILLAAKSSKKKIDGKLSSPWKLVKQFCEDNNI